VIRAARDHELALFAAHYQRVGFSPRMAEVVRFARDTLGGEIFVVERDGGLAGVSACAHFGASGWIGAVGVVPEARRGGIGGALTEAAAERLRQLGARTVMLYATDMGRPVYERLGFVAEGECVTVATAPPGGAPLPGGVRFAVPDDLEAALALDRSATGEDRSRLLAPLWPGGGLVAESRGGLRGYFLPSPWRPGGAIVADDPRSGLALLAWARQHAGGEFDLSLPGGNAPALRALGASGAREQRRATRMRLGPPLPWRPLSLFSVFNLFWG
jgi:GNAT superfamily N-acetyltransferase